MIDDGYIKFQIDWEKGPVPDADLTELIAARNRLFELGLIGVYEAEGIGYENVSLRMGNTGEFVVSGTQTGGVPRAGAGHFTKVVEWNLEKNALRCTGPMKASSESLTHAAVYACDPAINAILHIHNEKMWRRMLDEYPTTKAEVSYGTPEMAREVYRLYAETELKEIGIFVMKGHFEGVFAFGKNVFEPLESLILEFGKD